MSEKEPSPEERERFTYLMNLVSKEFTSPDPIKRARAVLVFLTSEGSNKRRRGEDVGLKDIEEVVKELGLEVPEQYST